MTPLEAPSALRSIALLAFALGVAAAPLRAEPAEHTVVIDGMAYQPATLHVKRGDRVVWVNRDLVPHTATARRGAFDSGNIAAGARWATTATQAGTLAYGCTYHPGMTATLVVE